MCLSRHVSLSPRMVYYDWSQHAGPAYIGGFYARSNPRGCAQLASTFAVPRAMSAAAGHWQAHVQRDTATYCIVPGHFVDASLGQRFKVFVDTALFVAVDTQGICQTRHVAEADDRACRRVRRVVE